MCEFQPPHMTGLRAVPSPLPYSRLTDPLGDIRHGISGGRDVGAVDLCLFHRVGEPPGDADALVGCGTEIVAPVGDRYPFLACPGICREAAGLGVVLAGDPLTVSTAARQQRVDRIP